MLSLLYKRFDRTNALVGVGVFISILTVYLLTKAPTLSFWDCGEFVAAAYTLGVPHPPGSPLYIIVARIFSIVPLFADIAVRVNFLSSLCNALAALFGYLSVVRILGLWYGTDRSVFTRFLIYAGAASGAFFMAFGRTQWTNSVETEVYGMTMLLFMAIFWLTLVYYEFRDTRMADRVILMIVYLATLGIGVHLTSLMILPVAALFFILKKDTPAKYWFMMAAFFTVELFLIFALSSRPGEIPYYVPVIVAMVFYAFYVFSFDKIPAKLMYVGAAFLLAIAPVFQVAYGAIKTAGQQAESAAAGSSGFLNIIGITALFGLSLYGLYGLYTLWQAKKRGEGLDTHTTVISLLTVAAGVLTLILISDIKGYAAFLIISAILVVALGLLARKHINWPILMAILAVAMVIIGVKPFFIGIAVFAVAITLIGATQKLPGWKTALMVLVVAVAGYSVHLYLPVRSSQSPIINQNNPSKGVATTINFLERKQYGSQGMVERMFVRRAEWENQFGNYQRMGFWHFFNEQFGLVGPKFFILFVIGLFGVWEVIRRKPSIGALILILLLISSVGLILYMNFADGLRTDAAGRDHIEVRDRDYFFTPMFVLFGLALGIGATMIVQFLRDTTRTYAPGLRKLTVGASCVVLLLPAYALSGNFNVCDRSRNVVPYDYAAGILGSCDEGAILFTGGDNDTFPIWCLQEVYDFRSDVKVVCLPLANTDWYIKQLRDDLGIDMAWTDEDIDALRGFRTQEGMVFRIQDQVIDRIIDVNGRTEPINFSATVGYGSRKYHGKAADSLLEQSGMMLRWVGVPGDRVDGDGSFEKFTTPEIFGFRGFADPTIHKDDATLRAINNIVNAMMIVVGDLKDEGKPEKAEQLTRFVLEKIPYAKGVPEYLGTLLAEQRKSEELQAYIDTTQYGDIPRLKTMLARVWRATGDPGKAEVMLKGMLNDDPSYRFAFEELSRLYIQANEFKGLELLFIDWLKANPSDQQVRGMLTELQKNLERLKREALEGK